MATWVLRYEKGKTSLDFNGARSAGVLGGCVLSTVFIEEMTTTGCRSIRKVVADIHYIRLHVCAHREGDLSQTGLGCVKFVFQLTLLEVILARPCTIVLVFLTSSHRYNCSYHAK